MTRSPAGINPSRLRAALRRPDDALPGNVPAHPGRGQEHHQFQGRREPAGAVQVQVGLEKYIAACANHWMPQGDMSRDIQLWKDPNGPRRRAPGHPQSRILRNGRLARGEQYRPAPPPLPRRIPPVLLRQAFEEAIHARLPVHRGEPDLTRASFSTPPRGRLDPRQGRVPDPVHRHAHRSGLQDWNAGGRPGAAEEPDRVPA